MIQGKSEPLIDLIKTLTKSEKRYFQVQSNQQLRKGKNNYILLFNYIIKFDSYNEELIKKQVKHEISDKDYSYTKSYLYKMLLKNLNTYHRERISIDSFLNEISLSIEILYNKALYKQALKICKKGIHKAKTHESLELLLVLKKWHFKLLEKLDKKNIEDYSLTSTNTLHNLLNNSKYKKISTEVFDYVIQRGISRNKSDTAALAKFISSSLEKINEQPISIESEIMLISIKGLYHYFGHEHNISLEYYQKSIDILTKNKEFGESNPEIYVSTYNNLIINSILSKNHSKAKKFLRNFKEYAHTLSEGNLKITAYSHIFSIKTPFSVDIGDFKEGYKDLIGTLDVYYKYEKKFNVSQNVHAKYYMAYLCYGNQKFKEALNWLNEILNIAETKDREDIFVYARILGLIIQYELNHYDLIEYQLVNTKNYLSQKKRAYKTEKLALKLLKTLILKPEKKATIYEMYQPIFETVLKQNGNANEYFRFLVWLKHKITGKSFEECFLASL
jgi:hypothetical protein